MRAVNLLPAPRVEKRRDSGDSRGRTTKAIAVAAAAALVLVVVAVVLAFTQARSDVSDRRAALDGVQADVAQMQAAASLSKAAAAQAQAHLSAVTTAASGRTAWDGLLDQLARVMPSGAWLESLQATAASASTSSTDTTTDTTTTSTAPTGFTVSGYALSQETVARALDRLALMPALSGVSLQSSQRADVAGKKAVQFTIGATLVAGGGIG
jgi:Tfp pilus assembly protein PilN